MGVMTGAPRSSPTPATRIGRDLGRVLVDPATPQRDLDIRSPHRYAILSDQHKGARDRADAFRQCEAAYRAALTSYADRQFTLILLGDVEELWEQDFPAVRRAYEELLALEASFGPERYVRIFGNHDDEWADPARVARRLAPYLPCPTVHEGLRFEVSDDGCPIGTILLVHGHQGTLLSQRWSAFSRRSMRLWRQAQRAFHVRIPTPSTDPCLRGEHDRQMYEWAAAQARLILIAGHTHRPVWSSRTHLQRLEAERAVLPTRDAAIDPTDRARIAALDAAIARRRREHPPCRDTEKTRPAYFNTGCCIFDDGDVTGIEIEDGALRLVKWPVGGADACIVLEEERIATVFEQLD